MRSKRMLMGAAVIGCVAATMMLGAYAQEANTTGQFNARFGQQPSTAAQPNATRQGQNADVNAHVNGRANGNRTATSGQLERRGFGNEGRLNASTREGRGIAEERGMRGQRGTYARVSEERYATACVVNAVRTRVSPRSVIAAGCAGSADCIRVKAAIAIGVASDWLIGSAPLVWAPAHARTMAIARAVSTPMRLPITSATQLAPTTTTRLVMM